VRAARATYLDRSVVEITLAAVTGARGRGEAAPLPGSSPDTLDDVRAALGRLRPLELDGCLPVVPQVRALLKDLDLGSPAAAFAVESALVEAAAGAARVPPAVVLRGTFPRHEVEANALLPDGTPDAVAAAALVLASRGYRTFKAKVGRPGRWDDEFAALRAVRAALDPGARLRVDANGAWAPDEARARLAALAPLGLEYVEQPVAPAVLPQFTGSPVPLAADESLAVPGAFETLLDGRACRVVVLKPMLLGGALACLELAQRASRAGLTVVVTGLLDGRLAQAATAALALALDPPPLACGLTGEIDLGPRLVVDAR
jgi:o-succinylbenzoate synthase